MSFSFITHANFLRTSQLFFSGPGLETRPIVGFEMVFGGIVPAEGARRKSVLTGIRELSNRL